MYFCISKGLDRQSLSSFNNFVGILNGPVALVVLSLEITFFYLNTRNCAQKVEAVCMLGTYVGGDISTEGKEIANLFPIFKKYSLNLLAIAGFDIYLMSFLWGFLNECDCQRSV